MKHLLVYKVGIAMMALSLAKTVYNLYLTYLAYPNIFYKTTTTTTNKWLHSNHFN